MADSAQGPLGLSTALLFPMQGAGDPRVRERVCWQQQRSLPWAAASTGPAALLRTGARSVIWARHTQHSWGAGTALVPSPRAASELQIAEAQPQGCGFRRCEAGSRGDARAAGLESSC